MGFIGELASEVLSEVTHSKNSSSSGPTGPPPHVVHPWIVQWEAGAGRWLFVNETNGERTFEYPGGKAAAGTGADSGLPTSSKPSEVTMTDHQVSQDGAGPWTAEVDTTSGNVAVSHREVNQDGSGPLPGEVAPIHRQVNQDGAGPYTREIDPGSGGTNSSAFKASKITQNVPGYAGGTGYQDQRPREENESSGHSGMTYGAMGAAGGVAAGALLMHEGDAIARNWDGDKERRQREFENAPYTPYRTAEFIGSGVGSVERDISEIPSHVERGADATAEYVGKGVGSVEHGVEDAVADFEALPEDVEMGAEEAGKWTERKWDGAVQDVEDIPQEIEGCVEGAVKWAGEGVGEAERFGDGVEAAYDEGEEKGSKH